MAAKIQDKEQLRQWLEKGAPVKFEFVKRFEVREQMATEVQKPAGGKIKIEPEAFQTVLQNESDRAVLTVDEVEIPEQQDVFVRVFINKPDASAQTSIDDPHY